MIRNYFKIAFRNLWKHRVFSFINILGLTVSMTACFLIFLYVRFEWSYDAFHAKADRMYRVNCDLKTPSELIKAGGPGWAIAPNLKKEFPEVESAVRLYTTSLLVRKDDVKFQELNSFFADSAFFNVFDLKLLHGDPVTALKDPFTVVFSESAAKKYFGNANPVGQTVLMTGQNWSVRVTGLMKDMPENSQIRADMIVSMPTLIRTLNVNPPLDEDWVDDGPPAYVLLKPGASAAALEAKLGSFVDRHAGTEMKKQQVFVNLSLQPVKDVYLHSSRPGTKTGNIKNVYILSFIAAVILLIACINFINLTTARSTERAREVGIRKVVGALKGQLGRQFVAESVFLSSIACVLTLILSALLLPSFNQLSGKRVSEGIFANPSLLLILLASSIGLGILAGFYPAWVLSSFRPSAVLKGRFASGKKGILLRKGLVIAQFTLSTGIIIATMVVYKQLTFMRDQDLGFRKDQMVVINTEGDPGITPFRESVKSLPGVRSVSISSSVPGSDNPNVISEMENNRGAMQVANMDLYFVDWDYIDQYKIRMAAGRPFSRDFQTDTTRAMIINETAVRLLGYASPQQALGKRFRQLGREGTIIGVVKDFHYHSLQQAIKPLSLRIEPTGCYLVSVNLSPDRLQASMAALESKWKSIIPYRPFLYYFLDESFDQQYRSEERFGKLFLYFAILAICISCMGLLGLASYSTLQRTREIGIRKVLGASVLSIINLLSADFLILVMISYLIAAPAAWWFMQGWLKNFAYRTGIGWWVFLAAGSMTVLVALFTISFQAIKAAIANPVKSLSSE
ncbi:MAG: ABC transporter permease [Bacteroidota bacterium]|nr:ABC transporter permease [Bacteroidota bacterium]MDP4245237.1 ABC transporter permease [Bacteroidota bacterium]MDP4255892.1 ABC transporter permease [Bacteroidota bacterium]MDP4260307.1 ABC transporter permease [Bacteroidota bacterium]